jgi:alanine racemase
MLDVTDTDAALGDRVVLFGASPLDLYSLSRLGATIPYEILTSISARVERIEG